MNEALLQLKNNLIKIYDAKESTNIAYLIIEKLCGLKRTDAIIHKNNLLNTEQINKLNNYTEQLINYKPVQYVLNEAWFAGIKLYVDENVLIPRPETEELVEWIVQEIPGFQFSVSSLTRSHSLLKIDNPTLTFDDSRFTILDIGTGSGCIAIALKKKILNADIYAFDVSEQALKVAAFNAQQNNVEIQFSKTDILSIEKKNNLPLFDVIVSNPPYIMQKESSEMHWNVLSYEPHLALFVPDENPLLFYKAISDFAVSHLKENGNLYFEINEDFGNNVTGLLQGKRFQSIEIKKDLQGKDRMTKAVYNPV